MQVREQTAAALCVVAVGITFLPWGRSGERSRTSHELVDVAGRAGVIPERYEAMSPAWYLVPALGGVAVVALALARHRLGAGATTTLGVVLGVGGLLVHRSPLVVEPAATAGIVVGAATALSGIVLLVGHTRSTAHEPAGTERPGRLRRPRG